MFFLMSADCSRGMGIGLMADKPQPRRTFAVNPNDGLRKCKHTNHVGKELPQDKKGEKVIKDARTTGNRRLWLATLVRAEWRRVAAPKMTTMMMIHSNSKSVSYGVLNYILSPQHHFQTSALTFYRCTGITVAICSRYGPDMAPTQYVFCFEHSGKIFSPFGRRSVGSIPFSVPTFLLLLLSVGLPVANAPGLLQPCGLLYHP